MLYYYLLAAAVVIIVGIAIGGLTFTRRRRARMDLEGMTFADPADAEPRAPDRDNGPAPEGPAATSGSPGVEELPDEWRAENGRSGPAGGDATSDDGARPEVIPVLAEAAYAVSAAAPAPAQTVVVTDPAPSASAAAPGSNGSAAALLADPLGGVILALVDGRGKLNGQDIKRLDVFRPERIELAVQTVELPPRLARDEDTLLRLAQVQLYAATLELRAKWSAQMPRPAGGAVPEPPYSARDFKLKMARDIMTLPATDRSEVIGYLLGGLLSGDGAGPELKRAVIDTLEHLRSTALVNVLLDCLDDPDPIIQDYALAAADRLLEE